MNAISPDSITYIHQLFLGDVTPQDAPHLQATCGIPGAGKSTFVDQKLADGTFTTNAYILNPDRVMIALPEYQEDMRMYGAQTAYEKWELPARDLAYAMAEKSFQNRFNIIKDMGCSNPLSLDLVKRLKAAGYRVAMPYIYCDTEEAFRRINERTFQISQDAVRERLALLETMLPEYQALADTFITYDNSNLETPYQIAA